MNADFVNAVSELLKMGGRDLVEKDFLIHSLLFDLSRNNYFKSNFLLKGGTCLIKCHLGYFRFSEDMDFTWREQSVFNGISQKEIRRKLSAAIEKVGDILEEIAARHGMDFKCRKADRNYVELVGSDKSATFKVWYDSMVLKRKTFLKIQINFVDLLLFAPVDKELASLFSALGDDEGKNLRPLFEKEFDAYSERPKLAVYDVREIFCEKARSILTRRSVKARDFLDLYLISAKFGLDPGEFKAEITAKIRFVLGMYERYRSNFEEKKKLLKSGAFFEWGNERELLIQKIDENKFHVFLNEIKSPLLEIVDNVSS